MQNDKKNIKGILSPRQGLQGRRAPARGLVRAAPTSTAHSSSGHVSTLEKGRSLGALQAVRRREPGRAPHSQRADSARPSGRRGRPAGSSWQRPPGAGRALATPAARRLFLAYRSSPAGPAARRSQGTTSCIAATAPATAAESNTRGQELRVPWRCERCGRTGAPGCHPHLSLRSASARPPGWPHPSKPRPGSLPPYPHSSAQAPDTPGPHFPPEVPNRVVCVPQAGPAPAPRNSPCFREIPKAPEEAHPSF